MSSGFAKRAMSCFWSIGRTALCVPFGIEACRPLTIGVMIPSGWIELQRIL